MSDGTTRRLSVFVPPHQLRRDYNVFSGPHADLHDRFQRRLEPGNYHLGYLNDLQDRLRAARLEAPHDVQLAAELAFVLLTNRPTRATVREAMGHLHAIGDAQPVGIDTTRLLELCTILLNRRGDQVGGHVPGRLNWSVNNECPMSCRGCYNAFSNRNLSLPEARVVIDRIAASGTTSLVISGGDPLLWSHLFDVIDYAADKGLELAVDTTGYTLTPETLKRLEGKIASLRLPVDGMSSVAQRAFRRNSDPDMVDRFKRSLDMCDEYGFAAVRVNTVASRANIDELAAIGEFVCGYSVVKQWMIMQWWDRRAPRSLVDEMWVDFAEVEAIARTVRNRFPETRVYWSAGRGRAFANVFIQANGQVLTFGSRVGEEFIVGDLLTQDLAEILANVAVDIDRLRETVPITGYPDPDGGTLSARLGVHEIEQVWG